VQEALTNVLRHARARRVIVALSPRGGCLEVLIRDDGEGFDVAGALTAAAGGKTMGLLGMQERVTLVGGELEIRSARGGGSEIRGRFPLAEAESPL
jgi:signal transduction histidine kinase